MRPSVSSYLGLLLIGACLLGARPAAAAATRNQATPGPGQRFAQPGIVVLKLAEDPGQLPGVGKTGVGALDQLLAAHAVASIEPISPRSRGARKPGGTDISRIFLVRYGDGADPEQVAGELGRTAGVEYAEPLWAYPLDAVPNDPNYVTQEINLEKMQFAAAWDFKKGQDGPVIVGLVDGGTWWRHQDLVANIWTNPGEIDGNLVDDDGNGYVDDIHGWNFGNSTNDPTGLPSTVASGRHGTHTAGIVCAVTNNGTQVAGASWNAKLMPINAALASRDGIIGWGYPGILYAADNGADIISLSWGGRGSPSLFERDIIDYVHGLGVAVVAAAGNDGGNYADDHFPSAYPHVLSVANVDFSDQKAALSNFGLTVDVTAQGEDILSTYPFNATAALSGTSMSAPHAAAACALVKTKWPGYTPDQVMERVRVTSDNIDALNIQYFGLLGFGRVNAYRALTKSTPALRITDLTLTETDGDGVIEPNETVSATVTVTNFLARATGINFTLTETSIHATVANGTQSVAAIDSMQSAVLGPFRINILSTAPVQTTITMTLGMSANGGTYLDKDRFPFVVSPVFVNHTINNVNTTVTSLGRLGFALVLGGSGSDGIGFTFKDGANILFEGAMMAGVSETRVSDSARGGRSTDPPEDDFQTLPSGSPKPTPAAIADEQSLAFFSDSRATSPLGIQLRQDAYEFATAPDDDYIILRYRIRNGGGAALSDFRVGWFFDWDIGGSGDGSPDANDRAAYDASRGLGYAYDVNGSADGVHVGVMVLTPPGTTSYRAIWNDQTLVSPPEWGLFDGFTKTEKWQCLHDGFGYTEAGPEDISQAIATGPFTIQPGDSVTVAFAFLAGDNLADLQANADAAKAKWQLFGPITPISILDLSAERAGDDVLVRWRTSVEQNVAAFRVHRATDAGALVALAPDVPPNSAHTYSFRDPSPTPGRYEYRIGEVAPDGSVVLHGGATIEFAPASPARSFLGPNVPNPFNPTTTLRYGLDAAGPVRLAVYDGRGRLVRMLARSAWSRPGFYTATWDGLDESGRAAASGVYHARLVLADRTLHWRLTLIK